MALSVIRGDRTPKAVRWLGGVGIALLLSLVSCFPESTASLPPQVDFPATWQTVAIGGGGYVTGLQIHPQDPDLAYIRTDNGGFFRWEPSQARWQPITDHFGRAQQNYYGGEAIALDPNHPNVVLIAVGEYGADGPGTVFRSEDRGQTWQPSNLRVPMGGDEEKRWAGNRLVVNPFDAKVVLFGSRNNGLWRSQDGGLTWSRVSQFVAQGDPKVGLHALSFDPSTPGRLYLGVYGDGIYVSPNAGQTWQPLRNSPTHPMQMAVAKDGRLYVTSDRSPGVSYYDQGQWTDITPPGFQDQVFNGLSLEANQPQTLLVSVGETGGAELFHSRDAGKSWRRLQHRFTNTVPWATDDFFRAHTASVQIAPNRSDQAWLTDWFGVWRTDNLQETPVFWKNYPQGHEQVVVFSLLAPPQGPLLLSGVADVTGFRHERLDTFPRERLGVDRSFVGQFDPQPWLRVDQDTYHFAYSANSPLTVVRVGGKRWNQTFGVHRSQDGGQTWRSLNFPAQTLPLRVAVSATDPDQMVVAVSEGQARVTQDGGQTWRLVQGLPAGPKGPWIWSQPLAADGGMGDRFYYYAEGILYRSDDAGANFQVLHSNLPRTDQYSIQTLPGQPNWVWVSLDKGGLYFSQDGGQTLVPVPTVAESYLFTVGAGTPVPLWYLYGSLRNGQQGIFVSADQGKRWQPIHEAKTAVGNRPRILEASKRETGLIFIGTNGRGIYYKRVRPH